MPLEGWSLPQSPTGKASLVPPPPWHYSGEVIAVDFTADTSAISSLLPDELSPTEGGEATFVFAHWSSRADADSRLGRDPARAQYHEAYVVLQSRYKDRKVGRVPYIWVDNDVSLVRGLIQGFPKKIGAIAMTRHVALGNGGAKKEIGGSFHGHLSSNGERLATAAVSISEVREKGYPPGVSLPLVHTRLWPSLTISDGPAVHELAMADISDFALGTLYTGQGELHFGDSLFEELHLLRPVSVGLGWVFSMAFSVQGGHVVSPSEVG